MTVRSAPITINVRQTGATIGFFNTKIAEINAFAPVLNAHGLKAPDYATNFESEFLRAWPSALEKHLLFFTTSNVPFGLTYAIQQAQRHGFQAIVYDNEPSNANLSTPKIEYTGRIQGIAAAAYNANIAGTQAKANGLKFGVAPSVALYNGRDFPSTFDGLDFSLLDFWQCQIDGGGAARIIKRVNAYVAPVKQAHPEVKIYVCINEDNPGPPNMTPADVASTWNAISKFCDGVEFHRYTTATEIDAVLKAVGR